MSLTKTMIISNFIIFQLAWIVCVEAAAHNAAWAGVLTIVIAVSIHVLLSQHKQQAIQLTAFCMLIGVVLETLLTSIHATQFNDDTFFILVVPLWMVALWALFSTTLNVSMRWLRGRYALSAILGAVVGPLSYFSGSKIGALTLPLNYSLPAIGLSWALAMPLLLVMAKRWDAFA